MLKTRILTVLILLPLFAAALFYLPQAGWALCVAPLALIGAWEWGALAGWGTRARFAYVGAIAVGAALLWHFGHGAAPEAQWVLVTAFAVSLLFWLLVAPLWLGGGWRVSSPIALAGAGALLLLPLWSALVWWHPNPGLLLLLMAIVWISDTAAYFCGRQWGRRKLAPSVSPGKTWEGVFGALVAVSGYYWLTSVAGMDRPAVLQGITGFGVYLFVTVLGIEGDLFESWIKRTAGVKDSGTLFPGHGGVMDRIDALTAGIPAVTLLVLVAR